MGFLIEDAVYPNPRKQAIVISFSDKYNNEIYPSFVFNDTKLQLATIQKHLGIILDSKLYLNYWYYK